MYSYIYYNDNLCFYIRKFSMHSVDRSGEKESGGTVVTVYLHPQMTRSAPFVVSHLWPSAQMQRSSASHTQLGTSSRALSALSALSRGQFNRWTGNSRTLFEGRSGGSQASSRITLMGPARDVNEAKTPEAEAEARTLEVKVEAKAEFIQFWPSEL